MNKTLLFAIGAFLLLGLGGFVIFSSYSSTASTPESQVETTTQLATNTPKSLKDLLTSEAVQECTYQDASGNQGVVQVSGNKLHGKFTMTSQAGESTIHHLIFEGATVYVWTEGETQGFKMSQDSLGDNQTETNIDAYNTNKQFDFTCKPWELDVSAFELPNEVTFLDTKALVIPTVNPSLPEDKSAQCAVCERVPESAQTQCKAALGCS